MSKKLPVKLAKDVLESYDLEQVIVLCRDKTGTDHFITYGNTKAACAEAAISADRMKRAFGWPEGSLSKYVTECLLPGCKSPMPHVHNQQTGEVVSTLESTG